MTPDSINSINDIREKYDPFPAVNNKILGIRNQATIQSTAYDHISKAVRHVSDYDLYSEWDRIYISAVTTICLASDLLREAENQRNLIGKEVVS